MKILKFSIFILIFITNSVYAQSSYFYYYKGEKQYLELDTKHIFISVSDTTQITAFDKIKQQPFQVDITQKIKLVNYQKRFWSVLSIEGILTEKAYLEKLLEIKNTRNDIIVAPYFKEKVGLSNFFYVKLKSLSDTTLLIQEVKKENAVVVYQNRFMPLWYVVSVTENSRFNAMEAANYYYESGLFQSAESDLMIEFQTACANDTYFQDQWGLKNTGQEFVTYTNLGADSIIFQATPGIDIKACEAWEITNGNNIIVAVIDHGIELNHPDLLANIYPLSYDTENKTSPSIVRGDHGTACAGIIGAAKNNSKGIAGVAPNCKLMSISNSLDGTPLSLENRAYGFNWAWQNGAAVISNSWKSNTKHEMLDMAIDSAVTYGRGGKDCVVVFASGNYSAAINVNTSVDYPARLPNVIAVGAISPCGERKYIKQGAVSCDGEEWGSCYDSQLNVMAPGVKISTTDRQGNLEYNPGKFIPNDYSDKDYTNRFNGTSAACPYVAGVAALILSVNPNLTQAQVRQIIESTCTKLPGYGNTTYTYGNNSAHPNDTWNIEMGHGLVNAHAAVLKAVQKAQCRDTLLPAVLGIINQNTTWNTPLQTVGNILIPNNVTLTITSQVKCDYDASIIIHPRGKLIIDGGTLTNACEGAMWQGITIIGDTTLLFPANQSKVEVINGGKIENAVCAIHATKGGSISTNNALFVNNLISIQIDPVLPAQASINTYELTQFTINDNFLGDLLDFETHIKLSGSKGVTLLGCTLVNNATIKNYDSGKNIGIWAFNSPLILKEYCPWYASVDQVTGICDTNYMTRNFFSGFSRAVSVANSGVTPVLKVRCSDFEDNLYGIYINGINNHELILNNFTLTQANSYGASINNATGYKIEENRFKNACPDPVTNKTVGLTINNSGTAENEVYKNYFDDLYMGQNFLFDNATVFGYGPYPGLQTLCNTFSNSQYRDIHVGTLRAQITLDHYIRKEQGSMQNPAGNQFQGNPILNIDNSSSPYSMNYYCRNANNEYPVNVTNVTQIPINYTNTCPSKIGMAGGSGGGTKRDALSQYDEWNAEYEYWLAKFLAFDGKEDEEEYKMLLDMVSHYSALKDNHFNAIVVSAFGKEEEKEKGEKENLRFLFNYRNSYTDNLSIIETYLAENNYSEALATLAKMYELFKITEEQASELKGLETYTHWLQQLEKEQNSIYTLSEKELNYLINYVETNTGRSTVFAKNILCELYGICLIDEVMRKLDDEIIDLRKSVESVSSVCRNALENITIHPNPTIGELRIENGELKIEKIEIYDVYGKKQSLNYLITSSSNQKIDISHLTAGIYLLRITAESGEIIKKIIKQ